MQAERIKKDIKELKASAKPKPARLLLYRDPGDLTDSEIERVLNEVPARDVPDALMIEYCNRKYGTSYKSIDNLPDGWPPEWEDPEDLEE